MSVRRLVLATAAMAVVAAGLTVLTGPWHAALPALGDVAGLTATADPDRVVLAAVGLLAWAVWTWGVLGLLLTAASGVPGACGDLARALARLVLPASLRTASGLALGVGLVVAGPPAAAAPESAQPAAVVPDWPAGDGGPAAPPPAPPDWPTAATPQVTGEHLVLPGDCLWRIAEDRLSADGADPTNAEVATAVHRWWSANESVIGADPDLIHPGQVLRPPPDPTTSTDLRPGSTR